MTYSYDTLRPNYLNRVSGGLISKYTYDGNGNMTYDSTKGTFTYDYRNMMIKAQLNVSQHKREFAYDANGQRIKFMFRGGNGQIRDSSRVYVRGSNGNIICEYRAKGNAPNQTWPVDHYNIYGNDLIGELRADSSKRFYYINDHLGSVRVILDSSGNVNSWNDFYPFGKISRSSSTVNTPKEKFTGKQHDDDSGLDYFGARYYNSEIGRWISVDPMAEYPSPFVYVGNNPIH